MGPVHKSDVGGVVLNIKTEEHLSLEFDRMMKIPEATAIIGTADVERNRVVYWS